MSLDSGPSSPTDGAGGERRGDRREDVAPVEGGAPRRQEEALVGELMMRRTLERGAASERSAVVGPDEERPRRLDAERPPRAADARIDHRDVDRAGRKVGHRLPQHERAGEHVLRRDAVRHVDDRHARRAGRDHALHDADEGVDVPEVGREGDHARRRAPPRPPPRGAGT